MVDQIYSYFPDLNDKQKQQIDALDGLYGEWNKKINVISRQDIDNLYEHHVLHSMAIAKVVQFSSKTEIIDIGTGGGFPGIPLAILFPDSNFLLVDSVRKKLDVAKNVADQIGLENIEVFHGRADSVNGEFDFAVSRAVSRLDEVWGWIENKIKHKHINTLPNGLIYLKGGDISSELPNNVNLTRWDIKQFYSEDYFKEKSILLLSKYEQNKGKTQL